MLRDKTSIEELKREYPVMENCILLGYRGSIAHGTYRPTNDPNSIDDKDLMGIVLPKKSVYTGLDKWGARGIGTKEIMYIW